MSGCFSLVVMAFESESDRYSQWSINAKQFCWNVLTILMLLLTCSMAHARNLEARVYYVIDYQYPTHYDTAEAAYAAWKSQYNPPHSVITWGDLTPAPAASNGTINGYTAVYWTPMSYINYDDSGHVISSGSSISGDRVILADYECPVGTTASMTGSGTAQIAQCVLPNNSDPGCELCQQSQPKIGNPIYPSTGVKLQEETDYNGEGSNALRFTRTYRSDRNNNWAHNYRVLGVDFTTVARNTVLPDGGCYPGIGTGSLIPYCFKYAATGSPNDVTVIRTGKRILDFGTASNLNPAADINDRVTRLTDGTNPIGLSVYNASDESTERFDVTGRLVSKTARDGKVQTMTYSDGSTPLTIAPSAGLLIRVTDNFGRQLNYTYDSNGRMISMIDPTGGITSYAYDESSSVVVSGSPVGNLTSVTYPDGRKRIYWYNEQDKTASTNLQYALTGITDELGTRFATYYYDTSGRAVSTEHAGSVEKYQVEYRFTLDRSVVTDPRSTARMYWYQTILGGIKNIKIDQPAGIGSGATSTSMTYDANGNVATRTDFNGSVTTYGYDLSRNLETSRVEASGTALARTITTAWHATYRLPLRIAEPKLLTTYTYDTSGNLLSKTLQATSDVTGAQGLLPTLVGTARTWSYTYNSVGQVLTATGPRTDVADKTIYTYDSSGNLSTITNAVGQVTTLSSYDANGRVGLITDANGATTALTYSPRGWLTGKTVTSGGTVETTIYSYDGVGQLTLVTLPNTSTISYAYDPPHRLTNIADSLGNSIAYTLDNMGNRIGEQVKDPSGALARQTSRVVDALNRIQQITGAVQ